MILEYWSKDPGQNGSDPGTDLLLNNFLKKQRKY